MNNNGVFMPADAPASGFANSGVAAVVTMVTLGNGATAAVREQISSLGANVLQLRPGQGFGRGKPVCALKSWIVQVDRPIRPHGEAGTQGLHSPSRAHRHQDRLAAEFFF